MIPPKYLSRNERINAPISFGLFISGPFLRLKNDRYNSMFDFFEFRYSSETGRSPEPELAREPRPPSSKRRFVLELQNFVIFVMIWEVNRREYDIPPITVNGRRISKVIIDEHVGKHPDISDSLILELVVKLDGADQAPDDVKAPFEYFANLIDIREKQYRVVWLLEENEIYV